ncbi:MAG TPA: serine/threonine-protein kinase [Gemmatimonadaceae bacterium]|nr:serine/threonine-protein kinase [Gemmatimonadaceae bacterium]
MQKSPVRSEYHPRFDRYSAPASRRTSDAAAGAVAHQDRELRALLRRRLLVFISVVVGFYGVLPIASIRFLWDPATTPLARWTLIAQFVAAALLTVVGVLAAKKPAKSMRTLRAFEISAFGIAASYLLVSDMIIAHQWALAAPPIGPLGHPLFTQTGMRLDPITLRWLVMVAAYGTLIPNTWRRNAAVVAVMGATYLASIVTLAVMRDVPLAQYPALLFYPVVWMIVASVLSIFGSYRVSVLEKRVYDAQRLGQYKLVRHLGAGGMGEVFLAEHVLLKQPFAIKMLSPERVADEKVLQRFEREVQAMAQLEHWNTVEVYDFGHAPDGTFYYVMEYLDGMDLEQMVRECGPLPPARAIHIVRQVCGALAEAHARGLLHRDIKPGNVIVSERAGQYDVAKLLDFGLVKSVKRSDDSDTLTQEGVVSGTPAFMSPEHASGSESIDGRSDIYSLGAVLYFLLTGRPVFAKETPLKTLAAQIYEDPAPPSRHRAGLDPMLEALVLRCLEKAPEARYPNADALDRALAACEAAGGEWTQLQAREWWTARAGRSRG